MQKSFVVASTTTLGSYTASDCPLPQCGTAGLFFVRQVPEPASPILLALGLCLICLARKGIPLLAMAEVRRQYIGPRELG